MRGLLLLGTDTGVGKTTVGCGLLRLAHRRGVRLVPYKPVETGCKPVETGFRAVETTHVPSAIGRELDPAPAPTDARRLCDAAALPGLRPEDICPLSLPEPVAPSVAARLAGRTISTDDIVAAGRALAEQGDALLVESAGGLLTPYGPGVTSATWADLFDIDVMLVAANRLGTINHAALALAEIGRRRLRLAGFVLVDVAPLPGPDHPFNAPEIASLTGVTSLGTVRHCATLDPNALADAVADGLDLSDVLGGILA